MTTNPFYVQESEDVNNNREHFPTEAAAREFAKITSSESEGKYDVCDTTDHGAVVASYRDGREVVGSYQGR